MENRIYIIILLIMLNQIKPTEISNATLLNTEDNFLTISEERYFQPKSVSLTRSQTAVDAYNILQLIEPSTVLLNPLYLSTRPIYIRSINDQPTYSSIPDNNKISKLYDSKIGTFSTDFFFHRIYSANLVNEKINIDSFLDLEAKDIIQTIESAQISKLNIPQILGLFKPLKIQQHDVGIMLNYYKSLEHLAIYAAIPMHYIERNFYITIAEQELIKRDVFFQQFEKNDYFKFAREHLICDKIGIGDLSLTFEKNFINDYRKEINGGVQFTIPTALAFKNGLIGSNFDQYKNRPSIDLYHGIIEPGLDYADDNTNEIAIETLKSNGYNLSIEALDRLSTLLLNAPLGNDCHFATELFYRQYTKFTEITYLLSKFSGKCFLPSTERRFFAHKNTKDELNQFFEDPQEGLRFFSEKLENHLFPSGVDVKVWPGFLFKMTSSLNHHYKLCHFFIGSNSYVQLNEQFSNFSVDSNVVNNLAIANAKKEFGWQQKIFGGVKYYNDFSKWSFSIHAESVSMSQLISKDIGLGCTISSTF